MDTYQGLAEIKNSLRLAVAELLENQDPEIELDEFLELCQEPNSGLDIDSMFPYYSERSIMARFAPDLEEPQGFTCLQDMEAVLAASWLETATADIAKEIYLS